MDCVRGFEAFVDSAVPPQFGLGQPLLEITGLLLKSQPLGKILVALCSFDEEG